jgi:hypothetical protein
MDQFTKPSEMMRANRPYLYSDSRTVEFYRLSESELSHHLESLTDRNQQKDFENFCRKLAERELCPNLRPQTGPEGGGDGKVDTETYPVDATISERWFVGDGKSGDENWAFAFSAKKAWKDKARSDVSGIVSTGRPYHRIFFITSRPARQVDRLALEAQLTSETGVPVIILDREWIISRVFARGHRDIVFEQLKAGEYCPDEVKLGPKDYERQQVLDEIETRLSRLGNEVPDQMQSIADSFEAARLSRELERPSYETEGRFRRAIRLAKKYGTTVQRLRATYEFAWTCVWWFDDIKAMSELYDDVETLAFDSRTSAHISRVCNLVTIMSGRIARGLETEAELSFEARSTRLNAILTELAEDSSRPNNALYAETLLTLNRMHDGLIDGDTDELDRIWTALSGILGRAKGLGEYPADLMDSMVEPLSMIAPDSVVFDSLVEQIADFMSERSKEVKAGELYLAQGQRKLDIEKPIEAIKWLGRAVVHLAKEECREQQSEALYCLAVGYRVAGLPWAARATILASIVQYLALSEIEGELRIQLIPAMKLFAHCCLRVGNVVDALAAHQFATTIAGAMTLDETSRKRVEEDGREFDGYLSTLIVIQPAHEIRRLENLPDVLSALGLVIANAVLLHRLGHDDALRSAGVLDGQIEEILEMVSSQPACADLPKTLVLYDPSFSSLRVRVLGVEIEIEMRSDFTQEAFLQVQAFAAALEGFVATLLNSRAFPFVEKRRIIMSRDRQLASSSIVREDDGSIIISTPEAWSLTDTATLGELNRHIIEGCVHALTSVALVSDTLEMIEDLVSKELVFERATLFCHAGMSRSRAFGTAVGRISDWSHWIAKSYAIRDDAPGPPSMPLPDEAAQETTASSYDGFDELQSHDDLVVRSIINPILWDSARWIGLCYAVGQIGQPPFLGLMFEDGSKGEAIFRDWGERFGRDDPEDAIRVSILKGIDKENPAHYRGHVTQDLEGLKAGAGKAIVASSKTTTMTVDNHTNLEMFLKHLEACGEYIMVPVSLGVAGPHLHREVGLLKRVFHVREAWQVGAHDVDAFAIRPDDDVLIPPDVENPPVNELRQWRDAMQSRRSG